MLGGCGVEQGGGRELTEQVLTILLHLRLGCVELLKKDIYPHRFLTHGNLRAKVEKESYLHARLPSDKVKAFF